MFMSNSVLVIALMIGGFAQLTAQTMTAKPERYILPGDNVFPEGIAYQVSTCDFFVGSSADGTIFRGNVEGGKIASFSPSNQNGRRTVAGMKVNERNYLFVAGGDTGFVFVYDTKSSNLIAKLNANSGSKPFINDVAIAPSGDAYFTDSYRPFLYKVAKNAVGNLQLKPWLDFTKTAVIYGSGFNLNGIAASNNDKYLIVVQTNTGKLYRISTATKAVTEIDLAGETLTGGDGIVLEDRTLRVVRNQQGVIAKVQFSEDFSRGFIASSFKDPSFAFPTAVARAGKRLLVVNSQLDKRNAGLSPALPFTVSNLFTL